MIIVISMLATLSIGILIFMNTLRFGALPDGKRLERIESSPNYRDGQFHNINPTPMITEGANYWSMTMDFFTKKVKEPTQLIPTKKTNLNTLDSDQDVLVWMGHSSYFMQLDGKKILVDPVLSGNASPLSFTTKAYKGSDIYTTDDIPQIDFLFITHDHWDHLDYKTLIELKPKIKLVITGLGIGAHLERWGYDQTIILEEDWNNEIGLGQGFNCRVLPARHFTGRGFKRNKALWASFALKTPNSNIYIGGDSGYDDHFKDIGANYGPFDLAILENGQYDTNWKYVHMMPAEVIQATIDLKAQNLFPVHSGKFTLGNHDWDEPLSRIATLRNDELFRLITPVIGEKVRLHDHNQVFSNWWESIE